MARTLQVPPRKVPFLSADGYVSTAWYNFFKAVEERLGGYDGLGVLAGAGITVTGADGQATVAITNTGVVAGVHASPTSITVNARGQITAISP